jgi:hypothetical protein
MSNFTYNCHHITPGAPKYNNLKTEGEGMKRKTRLISSDPFLTWTLEFRLQTKAERDNILTHFNGQYGDTIPFYWTSVPTYISNASYYYVRYAADGYSEEVIASSIFNITLKFESA